MHASPKWPFLSGCPPVFTGALRPVRIPWHDLHDASLSFVGVGPSPLQRSRPLNASSSPTVRNSKGSTPYFRRGCNGAILAVYNFKSYQMFILRLLKSVLLEFIRHMARQAVISAVWQVKVIDSLSPSHRHHHLLPWFDILTIPTLRRACSVLMV